MRSTSTIFALAGLAAASPVSVVHQNVAVAPQAGELGPFHFTSTFNLVATPDLVVDADSVAAPGESGAIGYYNYGINSELDIICYVSRGILIFLDLPWLTLFLFTEHHSCRRHWSL